MFQAHISSLIKSKFTSYKDFDTMMYTCAAEFDFMEVEVSQTHRCYLNSINIQSCSSSS